MASGAVCSIEAFFPLFSLSLNMAGILLIDSWVKMVLERFDRVQLLASAKENADGCPSAQQLKFEFWRCSSEMLPPSYRVAAAISDTMVAAATGGKEKGAGMDMWIGDPLHWACELTRKGDRLAQLNDFLTQGHYYYLRPDQWCVIDFDMASSSKEKPPLQANLVQVTFDDATLTTAHVASGKRMSYEIVLSDRQQ
jgi:hypothetical protein